MAWHAHMLNPRAFLEDCIRYGKMSFWATEFPLAIINDCIHDRTLVYDPSEAAQERFITRARRSWDNRDDPDTKAVIYVLGARVRWTFPGLRVSRPSEPAMMLGRATGSQTRTST